MTPAHNNAPSRKAGKGFPWLSHRTVAEVWGPKRAEMAELDALSRTRALTDAESMRLERLMRNAA